MTIMVLPNAPRDMPVIFLKQITDEIGFEIIYVAALRSVGVPARLDAKNQAKLNDVTPGTAAGDCHSAILPPFFAGAKRIFEHLND